MFRILTIGDSHTAGFPGFNPINGGNPESSYQYWLKKSLLNQEKFIDKQIEIENYGIPGDSSNGVLKRLKFLIINNQKNPIQLIIINGGGNDWGNDIIDITSTLENLKQATLFTRSKNIPVIISSISPFSNKNIIAQLNNIAIHLEEFVNNLKDIKVIYFNWFNSLLGSNKNKLRKDFDSGDHEHLNSKGYRHIGELLANLIINAFKSQ